jgi:hypothetical protein
VGSDASPHSEYAAWTLTNGNDDMKEHQLEFQLADDEYRPACSPLDPSYSNTLRPLGVFKLWDRRQYGRKSVTSIYVDSRSLQDSLAGTKPREMMTHGSHGGTCTIA